MSALREAVDQRPMTTFQWSAIGVCMVLNMIGGFDVLVMAFTAASVSADWKINGARLGVLLSAGLFGMAAGSLLVAPWADRIGRKPLIMVCLAVCGSGMLASSFAKSEWELGVMRALTGLGVGGILACSNVIASWGTRLRRGSDRWLNEQARAWCRRQRSGIRKREFLHRKEALWETPDC